MTSREKHVNRIFEHLCHLRNFWQKARGWAPEEAADMLEEVRLDRLASLARCLRLWLPDSPAEEEDGRLILARVHLGALVEGALVFVLCVFLLDYKRKRKTRPDHIDLNDARTYFVKNIWTQEEQATWNPWIEKVQKRRNAIHVLKDRDIAGWDEFWSEVADFAELLTVLDDRLPYPNDFYQYGNDL
jgi:hypothetical protein